MADMLLQIFEMELFTSNDPNEVTISGSISGMFRDNLRHETCSLTVEELADKLLGAPLKDNTGKIVGRITSVDAKNDVWCGTYVFAKGE